MGNVIVIGDSCGACVRTGGLGGTHAGTVGDSSENPASSPAASTGSAAWKRSLPKKTSHTSRVM